MVLWDSGDYFATYLRFLISAESLTALRIIPTRWALAVHGTLLMDDLFDVSLQQIQLIVIGPNTLRRAEREIVFCEHCHLSRMPIRGRSLPEIILYCSKPHMRRPS